MTLREFLEELRAMREGPHHSYTWRQPHPESYGLIRTKPTPKEVSMTKYQATLIAGGFSEREAREMERRALRGEPIGPADAAARIQTEEQD